VFDELCEMLCEEIHKIQQKENMTPVALAQCPKAVEWSPVALAQAE